MKTEIETWKLQLAKARHALDHAQSRLAENRRDMLTLQRSLKEAQGRLDAINAVDSMLKRQLGLKS